MKMGDKVIVYGYIDGYSYETTGQTNYIIALETGERVEIPLGGVINVDEIVFKDNIKLKDVIKRIKEFDDGTKFKWMYDILKELGSDFGSKMFHEAYQQGRFDESIETHYKSQKVVVPQFVADWIEVAKTVYSLSGGMTYGGPGVNKWLENEDNQRTFVLAWFNGYIVEDEKRHLVKIKGICGNHETLNREKHSNKWLFSDREENSLYCTHHTRKELEDAGFGWVFDCEGIEIEEVE